MTLFYVAGGDSWPSSLPKNNKDGCGDYSACTMTVLSCVISCARSIQSAEGGGGGGRRPGSGDGFSEQEFVLLFQNKNTKFYICILYAGQPGFPNVGNACK